MVGGQQRPLLVLGQVSAGVGNAWGVGYQSIEGHGTQCHHEFGVEQLELAVEDGYAGLDFIGLGVAIAWGSAFNDIGDIDILAG